ALGQTAAECGKHVRGILRRPCAHEPDHRHRCRARRERPRRGRAAEKRDELAPLHVEHGGLLYQRRRPTRALGFPHVQPDAERPESPWGTCSIPRPATFREAACAQPAAPGCASSFAHTSNPENTIDEQAVDLAISSKKSSGALTLCVRLEAEVLIKL